MHESVSLVNLLCRWMLVCAGSVLSLHVVMFWLSHCFSQKIEVHRKQLDVSLVSMIDFLMSMFISMALVQIRKFKFLFK